MLYVSAVQFLRLSTKKVYQSNLIIKNDSKQASVEIFWEIAFFAAEKNVIPRKETFRNS